MLERPFPPFSVMRHSAPFSYPKKEEMILMTVFQTAYFLLPSCWTSPYPSSSNTSSTDPKNVGMRS